MWCGKIFRKRPVWSRVEGTFSLNEKNQYRNIQLSYLPSKGPRNLFLGLLERPKCQIVFFLVPNIVDTPMEALPLLVIHLFNQDVPDFVLRMC